jgi:tetratricopeptide (TPR) repeat protein
VLDGFDAVAGEVLAIDEDATVDKLDKDIREELAQLTRDKAADVAGHLVMAGRNLDEDPELAYRHARTAMKMASRLASTREAAGLAAYLTGRYSEALADLRTVRRITGTNDHWAVMADCERGLGRPERALAMATAPEAKTLDKETQIELRMVAAGARMDMEQPEAAVVMLQGADLTPAQIQPYTARLRYAYAEALLASERPEEAREWFSRAAEADTEGTTDAADRVDEMDGIAFEEIEDELDVEAAAEFEGDEDEHEEDEHDEHDRDLEGDFDDEDEDEDGEVEVEVEDDHDEHGHAPRVKDEPSDEA